MDGPGGRNPPSEPSRPTSSSSSLRTANRDSLLSRPGRGRPRCVWGAGSSPQPVAALGIRDPPSLLLPPPGRMLNPVLDQLALVLVEGCGSVGVRQMAWAVARLSGRPGRSRESWVTNSVGSHVVPGTVVPRSMFWARQKMRWLLVEVTLGDPHLFEETPIGWARVYSCSHFRI